MSQSNESKLLDAYAVLRTLDPSLYRISEDEARFLKECTGIKDDEDLKQHILQVQAEAFAIFPYPCIRRFAFIDSPLPKNADYPAVLELAKSRENAILLDIGCGFANDARRAIFDGFPLKNVICSDLRKEFYNMGHKLFKTTPETFPLAFFEGDIFETKFTTTDAVDTIPDLHSLKNLGQLRSKVSVINASAFFHIFSNEKQREMAHMLSKLLSPQPGSIILGCQGGAPTLQAFPSHVSDTIALHCPETWIELWTGTGGPFKPDEVEVRAYTQSLSLERLGLSSAENPGAKGHWLLWSVKRK